MTKKKIFNICTKCSAPNHIDNCDTCFGFGVLTIRSRDGLVPVRGGISKIVKDGAWSTCPECGSTPKGVNK